MSAGTARRAAAPARRHGLPAPFAGSPAEQHPGEQRVASSGPPFFGRQGPGLSAGNWGEKGLPQPLCCGWQRGWHRGMQQPGALSCPCPPGRCLLGSWRWRGEAPAGRRAGWCLLTLVHSRMSGSQSRAGQTKRTQRPFSLASACSCRNSGLPRLLGGSRSCQPQLFGSCRRWVMQCSAPADTKMGITSQMPSLMPATNASPSFSLPSEFFPAETVPDEVVVAPWWWSQGSLVPLHLGLCRREHLCLGVLTAKT